MATVWERVEKLAGQTLRTKTGKPFQVAAVDRQYVTVIPASTKAPRNVRRVEIEAAYGLDLPLAGLTATRLVQEQGTSFNPVYVVAILKALGGGTEETALPKPSVAILPEQVTTEEFISQLERIGKLHQEGVLSDQDFSQAKLRLLKATE